MAWIRNMNRKGKYSKKKSVIIRRSGLEGKNLVLDRYKVPGKKNLYVTGYNPFVVGFPNKYYTRLRYAQIISIDPSNSGLSATHVFRANSLYDPDLTGAGHQPLYRDELALIYGKYCVMGAKCTMTPIIEGIPQTSQFYYGLAHGNNTSDYQTMSLENLLEQERTSKVLRTQPANTYIANAPISKMITAKTYFSLKKDLQKNGKDDTVSAAMGANPALQHYFICWGVHPTGATEPTAVKFMVTIEYFVKCFEPITPVQS